MSGELPHIQFEAGHPAGPQGTVAKFPLQKAFPDILSQRRPRRFKELRPPSLGFSSLSAKDCRHGDLRGKSPRAMEKSSHLSDPRSALRYRPGQTERLSQARPEGLPEEWLNGLSAQVPNGFLLPGAPVWIIEAADEGGARLLSGHTTTANGQSTG
jgi:hypothetical protein